jgi:hypothetical protein
LSCDFQNLLKRHERSEKSKIGGINETATIYLFAQIYVIINDRLMRSDSDNFVEYFICFIGFATSNKFFRCHGI